MCTQQVMENMYVIITMYTAIHNYIVYIYNIASLYRKAVEVYGSS